MQKELRFYVSLDKSIAILSADGVSQAFHKEQGLNCANKNGISISFIFDFCSLFGVSRVVCGAHLRMLAPWAMRLLSWSHAALSTSSLIRSFENKKIYSLEMRYS